jgi:hypothetical protein
MRCMPVCLQVVFCAAGEICDTPLVGHPPGCTDGHGWKVLLWLVHIVNESSFADIILQAPIGCSAAHTCKVLLSLASLELLVL